MKKCPECGYERPDYFVCVNRIATGAMNKLRQELKRQNPTFEEIYNKIKNSPAGTVFKTSDVLELYRVQNKTSGDILRSTLDYCVCRGLVDKIRTGTKVRGHIWKRRSKDYPCPHFGGSENQKFAYSCTFEWKDARPREYECADTTSDTIGGGFQ